jgi:hypothetical protein
VELNGVGSREGLGSWWPTSNVAWVTVVVAGSQRQVGQPHSHLDLRLRQERCALRSQLKLHTD